MHLFKFIRNWRFINKSIKLSLLIINAEIYNMKVLSHPSIDKNNNVNKIKSEYQMKIVWINVILFGILHLVAFFGIFLIVKGRPAPATIIFDLVVGILSQIGVTAGAHRLWSHRSYKATLPLRLLLVVLDTFVYETSIINWSRDHRLHHKYSDTNADPHNVNRGFFFSHIGWIMVKKHPEVKEKQRCIDLSDLYQDPLLKFQHKHYMTLMTIACFVIPVIVPTYFWMETFANAFSLNILRYLIIVHNTLTINSLAHRFGNKPYDRSIRPSDSTGVSLVTFGEGFHNYHHTFPWDYKSSEFGAFSFNLTRNFIEFFAKIGWAYELKFASEDMVRRRVSRTGDGSHEIWGWGDKDQPQSDYSSAIILNKMKKSLVL